MMLSRVGKLLRMLQGVLGAGLVLRLKEYATILFCFSCNVYEGVDGTGFGLLRAPLAERLGWYFNCYRQRVAGLEPEG